MNDVSLQAIGMLLLRHFAGYAAGFALAHGWANGYTSEQIVSAIVLLGTLLYSWLQKQGQAEALALAEALRQRAFADVEYWRGKALKQPPAPSVAAKAQPLTPPGGTKLPQP